MPSIDHMNQNKLPDVAIHKPMLSISIGGMHTGKEVVHKGPGGREGGREGGPFSKPASHRHHSGAP